MYRPPSAKIDYHEGILNDLEIISSYNSNTILMGDLNYDALKPGELIKIHQIESSFLLSQIITQPTRITVSTSTLIDHIYITDSLTPVNSGVLPVALSDLIRFLLLSL